MPAVAKLVNPVPRSSDPNKEFRILPLSVRNLNLVFTGNDIPGFQAANSIRNLIQGAVQ